VILCPVAVRKSLRVSAVVVGAAIGSCIPPELGYKEPDSSEGATGGGGSSGVGGLGGSAAGGSAGSGGLGGMGASAGHGGTAGLDASTAGNGGNPGGGTGGNEDASAGTGGDAGSAGSGGGGGGAGTSGCPAGLPGPGLVQVSSASGSYCIDATEVTNAHYAAFLATTPPTGGQVPKCSWNSNYTPAGDWPAVGNDDYPVGFVDWCDAMAYCLWAGKRLCGKIGGGPNSPLDVTNASKSQWYNACSAGGTTVYPYGNIYDGARCNGFDHPTEGRIAVASASDCRSAQVGVYDMAGNVFEWEDSCSGNSGASDTCFTRGGAYESPQVVVRCDYETQFYRNATGVTGPYLGFRCCAP
jgi:sulfatase modifying factor 1